MASAEASYAALKLIDVTNEYSKITGIHPLIKAIIEDEDSERKLITVVEHEVNLINAQSPDLEDHEITVYQKAFVHFMTSNYDAAICLFVEEILGMKLLPEADRASVLESSLEVRAGLLEAPRSGNGAKSATSPRSNTHAITNTATTNNPTQGVVASSQLTRKHATTIVRLESVLNTARTELQQAEHDSYKERDHAKFLRDTVDNLVEYIGNLRASQPPVVAIDFYEDKLPGLLALREDAAQRAKEGYNGKGRPFERGRRAPRLRPSPKREDAVLHSPRAPGHSGVVRRGKWSGEYRDVDRYRPASRR